MPMGEHLDELEAGYLACKEWLGGPAGETERVNLVATFESGLFEVILTQSSFPTLSELLGEYENGHRLVDFRSNNFLVGFRNALLEEVSAEPD